MAQRRPLVLIPGAVGVEPRIVEMPVGDTVAPGTVLAAPVVMPPQYRIASLLPRNIAGAQVTSGTIYWVYVGQVARSFVPTRPHVYLTALGVGDPSNVYIGLGSSAAEPTSNDASILITALDPRGYLTVSEFAAGSLGVRTPPSIVVATVPAGTFLWGCFRLQTTGTPPSFVALFDDTAGHLRTTPGAALVSNGTTYTASVPASANSSMAVCPDLTFGVSSFAP